MTEKELISLWASSPKIEQIKFKKSRMMLDTQYGLHRMNSIVRRGIIVETISAFIVVPLFLFLAYKIPPLLSKIASILIIGYVIWYLIHIRKLRNKKPNSLTLNYLDYLQENKRYVSLLVKAASSSFYWYFLPIACFTMLFAIGLDRKLEIKLAFFGSMPIFGTLYYLYAKWFTRKIYKSKLDKLNELIKAISE